MYRKLISSVVVLALAGTVVLAQSWDRFNDRLIASSVVAVPDGSAGAPSYSFANDSNSGIYSGGVDNIRVSLGGTQYQGWFADQFQLKSTSTLDWSSGTVGQSSDVSLSRGAANRLDLASGDSFNIVDGNITVGGGQISSGSGSNLALNPNTGLVTVAGQVNVASATATPAGGSTAARLVIGTTNGFGIYIGSGAPTVSAAQGSLYLRSDGSSTSTRLYVNSSAGSGTTWTAVTTAT